MASVRGSGEADDAELVHLARNRDHDHGHNNGVEVAFGRAQFDLRVSAAFRHAVQGGHRTVAEDQTLGDGGIVWTKMMHIRAIVRNDELMMIEI